MTKYDRLTERKGNGVCYKTSEYLITCYPKNNNLSDIDKIAVKLCELEEKIENGELVSKEWHDEQVLHAESEVKSLRKYIAGVLLCVRGAKGGYFDLKRYERQVVKEFAEKLRARINKCDYVNGYAELGLCEEIDELLKEYEK